MAGVLAAAGLIALAEGPARLHEDHANARRLAEGVAETVPGAVDPADVATNIVFADVALAPGAAPRPGPDCPRPSQPGSCGPGMTTLRFLTSARFFISIYG